MSKQRSKLWLPDDRIVQPDPLRSMGSARRELGGIGGLNSCCCRTLENCCSGPEAPDSVVVDGLNANLGSQSVSFGPPWSCGYLPSCGWDDGPHTLDGGSVGTYLDYVKAGDMYPDCGNYPYCWSYGWFIRITCVDIGSQRKSRLLFRYRDFCCEKYAAWECAYLNFQKESVLKTPDSSYDCLTELFGDEWDNVLEVPYLGMSYDDYTLSPATNCPPLGTDPLGGFVEVWLNL